MSVTIVGEVSGNKAEVTDEGFLQTSQPVDAEHAGISVGAGRSGEAGDPYGLLQRTMEMTRDYRARVVSEQCTFSEFFGIVQGPHIFSNGNGMTPSFTGGGNGGVIINNAASITVNHYWSVSTNRRFAFPSEGKTYISFRFKWNRIEEGNYWSVSLCCSAQTLQQTAHIANGILIRRNPDGTFVLAVRANGADSVVVAIDESDLAVDHVHRFVLGVTADSVELWINDALFASETLEPGLLSRAYDYLGSSFAPCVHMWNVTAPAAAVTVSLLEWSVWDAAQTISQSPLDFALGRGLVLPNTPAYNTHATAWTNSVAPTSLSLSNTTATVQNAGGIVSFAAVASANTDYIIGVYYPDAGTSASGPSTLGKIFVCTGVTILGLNLGAANSATVPTVLMFGVGFGSNSGVTLANSDNGAMKAARRFPVGQLHIPVNALVGQPADRTIEHTFPNPIPVHNAECVHLIMRVMSGAATPSQVIHLQFQLHGYWL